MKRSTRVASLFILLFFFFFNGLQVYLIIDRVAEAKNKFRAEATTALLSTLSEYNKLKAIDSAAKPTHGWIVSARKKISMSRPDSQTILFKIPASSISADTLDPQVIESVLSSTVSRLPDMASFDTLYQKALLARKIKTRFRLDTVDMSNRKFERPILLKMIESKRDQQYAFATNPMRVPYNANISLIAQLQYQAAFIRKDLQGPVLSYGLIILIGNLALLFVYRTIRKQKRMNEMKTDFINNMTHEMKTPITIASAGLDALQLQVPANEKTDFYLDTSRKQLQLLNEFTERILDAAVKDMSDFVVKKVDIELVGMFETLLQSHAILDGKPVSFQLNAEGLVYFQGDRLHLETAFRNMIDNAIKYSGDTVEIAIDVKENDRAVVIQIVDNGIGVPPRYVKHLFEKFFRVPQGDAQSVKGFGLGLYYVNSIIKKHSGTIVVQSKPGTGTEFIITLPKNR